MPIYKYEFSHSIHLLIVVIIWFRTLTYKDFIKVFLTCPAIVGDIRMLDVQKKIFILCPDMDYIQQIGSPNLVIAIVSYSNSFNC